jgi:hypothetical protein
MRDRLVVTCVVLLVFFGVSGAAEPDKTAGAKLVDVEPIFALSDDAKVRETQGFGSMKLSPDGKKLLYIRRREVAPAAEGRSVRAYDLILRDLVTKKEKPLKIPAYTWDDIAIMMLSMNVFDPAGDRITLAAGVDRNGNGLHDYRDAKEPLQAILYDLASDKITTIDVQASIVLSTFDRTGKRLIIIKAERDARTGNMFTTPADKIDLKACSCWGLPRSVCPTADLLPLVILPSRETPGERSKMTFVAFDLNSDKILCTLPTHERNTKLDDCNPQWTANGRLLYYVDVEMTPDNGGQQRKRLSRIWDRTSRKVVGRVDRVVAIGPVATKTAMLLASRESGSDELVVHDHAAGKRWMLSGESVRPINVQGGYILYVRADKNGKQTLYRARVQLPEAKPAAK